MNKLIVLALLAAATWAAAECVERPQGRPLKIEVASCEEIDGRKDKAVLERGRDPHGDWDPKDAYTGAMIFDKNGSSWMYPSKKTHPCKAFPRKKTVTKRAYYTCCDTGPWGKCVFGGKWLMDMDGKTFNPFQ